jgi:hypothetical protein
VYSLITAGKYDFRFWRSYTAIRRAAEDGNPATTDATWLPLLSPVAPKFAQGTIELQRINIEQQAGNRSIRQLSRVACRTMTESLSRDDTAPHDEATSSARPHHRTPQPDLR